MKLKLETIMATKADGVLHHVEADRVDGALPQRLGDQEESIPER